MGVSGVQGNQSFLATPLKTKNLNGGLSDMKGQTQPPPPPPLVLGMRVINPLEYVSLSVGFKQSGLQV